MHEPFFTSSNLVVCPNVLRVDDYQRRVPGLSVFEWRDIRKRNPNLIQEHQMTPAQCDEWRASLFWGQSRVGMADDGRATRWLLTLVDRVPTVLDALELRPDEEQAFELLYLASSLLEIPGGHQGAALQWRNRLVAVLLRPEFHLRPEIVEERVQQFMGQDSGENGHGHQAD